MNFSAADQVCFVSYVKRFRVFLLLTYIFYDTDNLIFYSLCSIVHLIFLCFALLKDVVILVFFLHLHVTQEEGDIGLFYKHIILMFAFKIWVLSLNCDWLIPNWQCLNFSTNRRDNFVYQHHFIAHCLIT